MHDRWGEHHPERLPEAITDAETRTKFQFGMRIDSEWTVGARVEMSPPVAGLLGEGEVLEHDPPRRLVHSMRALWSDAVRVEGTSRVTWDIAVIGDDACRLLVTHDELREGAHKELYGGWPMILSGLKTWLETGEVLTTPGSLLYG